MNFTKENLMTTMQSEDFFADRMKKINDHLKTDGYKVFKFNYEDDTEVIEGTYVYTNEIDINTITFVHNEISDSEETPYIIDANNVLYDLDPCGKKILRQMTNVKYIEGEVKYFDEEGNEYDPY